MKQLDEAGSGRRGGESRCDLLATVVGNLTAAAMTKRS